MMLSENIKTFRNKNKLSPENLAIAINVNPQVILSWENGNDIPDLDNLIRLADYFNISLDMLTGRVNENLNLSVSNRKCSYCGKRTSFYDDISNIAYCSSSCRELYQLSLDKIKKNLVWFTIGIVISILLLLFGAFFKTSIKSNYIIGSGIAVLGITLIVFPYCTPEAYRMYGIQKTTLIGRTLGILSELFGLIIIFLL